MKNKATAGLCRTSRSGLSSLSLSLPNAIHLEGSPGSCWGRTLAPRDRACQKITHTHILVTAFPQSLLGFPICNQESACTALPVLFQALHLALIASSLLNLKLITTVDCLDPQPIKGGRQGTLWVILNYPLELMTKIIPR